MVRAASQDIVVLGSRRKAKLEAIVRRPSSPQALVRRARIVLLAHQRQANAQIAAQLGCSLMTVRTWRRRFTRGGIPALSDRPRSGRPEVYGPDVRLAIVATATSAPPDGASAWTHSMIAASLPGTGISASQAGRVLGPGAGAAPGPRLAEPPRRRAVLGPGRRGVRGIPAPAAGHRGDLHRREDRHPGQAPQIPPAEPRPGRLARREFEYVRNGTVSIVAALEASTGQVMTEPIARNDSVTFTGFLHRLDQCTDPRLAIHLVMDNGSSHTPAPPGPGSPRTPGSRHLHAQTRLLAGHGRTVVLRPDPRPAAPGRIHLPR